MDVIAALIELMFSKLTNTITDALSLLSTSPESYNGAMYSFAKNISSVFQGIAVPLMILFFFLGLSDAGRTIGDIRRPEIVISEFVRLVIAYFFVTKATELLTRILAVGMEVVVTAWNSAYSIGGIPNMAADNTVLEALENTDISLWSWSGFGDTAILLLLNLILILAISIVMICIAVFVYVRLFKIYIYIALAPLPMATFAWQSASDIGKQFIKSFCGVLLQGLVMVLALFLFTVFYNNIPITSTDTIGIVWEYFVGISVELIVLLLVVRGSDEIVYKMIGI